MTCEEKLEKCLAALHLVTIWRNKEVNVCGCYGEAVTVHAIREAFEACEQEWNEEDRNFGSKR